MESSDTLLPNEIKQGWGQVPRGHWIVADSQANTHDENTAVNVYYQMPFSSTDKVLLLQQVRFCLHSAVVAVVIVAPDVLRRHCDRVLSDGRTCGVFSHSQTKMLRDLAHGAFQT